MDKQPFRYDYVGSFLRPEGLKEARAAFHAGRISRVELTQAEDAAIRDLVAKQKAAGFPVINDGEFRRAYWHLDFMWGFQGVEHIELPRGTFFLGDETPQGSVRLTGKLGGEHHPFVRHFQFVKALEDENTVAKQTIPAPAQFYAELFRENNDRDTLKVYPDQQELVEDIAAAYRQVIRDLYDAGCRNLQLDDGTWGMVCDNSFCCQMKFEGYDMDKLQETYLALNNAALSEVPQDMRVTTHVCRGNYHSTWASRGGYEPVAPRLFGEEQVDAFYLEFDDARSGGFEPLRFVPAGKQVVLGLITTKTPKLEWKKAVISRIREASQYIPLENLSLSPQCGFASWEIGNKLTEGEQWAKLALVKDIAQEVWGQ